MHYCRLFTSHWTFKTGVRSFLHLGRHDKPPLFVYNKSGSTWAKDRSTDQLMEPGAVRAVPYLAPPAPSLGRRPNRRATSNGGLFNLNIILDKQER